MMQFYLQVNHEMVELLKFLSFVHTSNEHPTPQYVHTVFVLLIRSLRISDSESESANKGP